MKQIKYLFATVIASLMVCSSCSDYLEVTPENSQVADDYWQTEQDVENVLFGGYYYLRSMVVDQLIPWGEVRAGIVYNEEKSNALQTWQMKPSNSLCDWSTLYKIINIANTVLERAEEAYHADDTYSEPELKSHYTEAYFLRAISYFYLVRNWRDVPLVTKAYANDNIEVNQPLSTEADVIAQIKQDLLAALQTGAAKESFETTWETKGRATKWAIYALLADVCLWSEDYAGAIQYCDGILESENPKTPVFLASPTRASYFTIFNPGNSNESIFELQWNYQEDQSNILPIIFDDQLVDDADHGRYAVSQAACGDFVNEYLAIVGDAGEDGAGEGGAGLLKESPRTYHGAFYPGGSGGMSLGMTVGYVWKYVGSTTEDKKRTSNNYDPNFIIYRVADVMLMKAEALLLKDGIEPSSENKLEAVKLINRIRERAALEDNIAAGMDDESALAEVDMYSQEELLEYLLDERKMEFLGEGKIWYDFLRMGRSNGNRYKSSFLISQVVNYCQTASESWVRSVLTSDNALFLPIQQAEIDRNPALTESQNPYYK